MRRGGPGGSIVVMTNATALLRPAPGAAAIVAPDRRAIAARWAMPVRFAAVGASGYAINVAAYALLLHAAGLDYRVAGAGAFLAAVANNFGWNRRWTFHARGGRAARQAARFLTVSVLTLALTLAALSVLVGPAGIAAVPAEAVATVAVTPLGFTANRLWVFAPDTGSSADHLGSSGACRGQRSSRDD
jgi:putative flippase GtrA